MFKAYPKIHALHKEECEGILFGKCYIQEKVDGANASIWLEEDGTVHYGSRTQDLVKKGDNFRGFGDWVKNKQELVWLFEKHPEFRLYGEWLVRHSIAYNEKAYQQFYLYDIEVGGERLPIEEVYLIADEFNLKTVKLFGVIENPTLEQIKEYAGKSDIGEVGEGVVIKNMDFINKFGVAQYGKYVTQEFKEDNAITFGGNNKHSDTYFETYYMNKYVTLERVRKIYHKAESMKGRPDMSFVPMIMNMVFNDVITEEGWSIAKELAKNGAQFNFRAFKTLCDRKSKKIFTEILEDRLIEF